MDHKRAYPTKQAFQLVEAGVDATIRQQPQKMQGVLREGLLDVAPASALKNLAALDGQVH